MTALQAGMILLLLLEAGVIAWYYYTHNKGRRPVYHVKIQFAHGIKVRLTLNEQQYEQFRAWASSADGYFEIDDERQNVKLYRNYLCSVEARKR
jgi:cbb3-type cytochrome oxidase subunit 3